MTQLELRPSPHQQDMEVGELLDSTLEADEIPVGFATMRRVYLSLPHLSVGRGADSQ